MLSTGVYWSWNHSNLCKFPIFSWIINGVLFPERSKFWALLFTQIPQYIGKSTGSTFYAIIQHKMWLLKLYNQNIILHDGHFEKTPVVTHKYIYKRLAVNSKAINWTSGKFYDPQVPPPCEGDSLLLWLNNVTMAS